MEILWQITEQDLQRVRGFYEPRQDHPFVKGRRERNIQGLRPQVTKSIFWEKMVACLFTTQQRSGPNSPINRFILSQPFPLRYALCSSQSQLQHYAEQVLSQSGGIRRSKTIAHEVTVNYQLLESGGWSTVLGIVRKLEQGATVHSERESALFISETFSGFGPKQSRNLLQALGLTKYEIPIDSRITKWLNEFGFPIRLSAAALADHNYYHFVLDGIQQLCEKCGIYPCLLDAAIFSSFDQEWSEEQIIW